MSTAAARSVPLRSPDRQPSAAPAAAPQRWLWLVPQRRPSVSRIPFAAVLVVVLGGGLLGLLLLNTLVAQNSFALHRLAAESVELQQREQLLAGQVQAMQAPGSLAARATKLGMVPGGPPAFLRVSDGRVLGKARAGVARPTPAPAPKPTPAAAGPAGVPAKAPSAAPSTAPGSPTWTESGPAR